MKSTVSLNLFPFSVTLNSFQGFFFSRLEDAETPEASGQHDGEIIKNKKPPKNSLFRRFLYLRI